MRTAYKVLAYIVAAEVALQAMFMVYGDAGLGKWIDGGGVLDTAVMESGGSPFPEVVGFILHGMNGMLVIPAVALALLIVSFFAGVPGGVKWAGVVLGLVVLQVTLGLLGHSVPMLGALHGLNALGLFTTAAYAARRARSDEAGDRLTAATS
jgi:hypothetical protein